MLRTSAWFAALALASNVSAQTIGVWDDRFCRLGVAMGCENIPSNVCCVIFPAGVGAAIQLIIDPVPIQTALFGFTGAKCETSRLFANPNECFKAPQSIPFFKAASWAANGARVNGTNLVQNNSTKECRKPNILMIVDPEKPGDHIRVPIPDGQLDAYAKIASDNNLTAVLELAGRLSN